jgi:very-short-patch-repair endonuclease
MRNYFSNKLLFKGFRKRLRNKSTAAEATLWNLIKNKQLDGRKFRRQHGLNNYIVDFYCSSERLIIELDGDSHGGYNKIEKDILREEFLKRHDYRMIRFENKEVHQNPEEVLNKIRKHFKK